MAGKTSVGDSKRLILRQAFTNGAFHSKGEDVVELREAEMVRGKTGHPSIKARAHRKAARYFASGIGRRLARVRHILFVFFFCLYFLLLRNR